jgi:hypothetical protein
MFMCVPVQILEIPGHDTRDRSRGQGFNKKVREKEKKSLPARDGNGYKPVGFCYLKPVPVKNIYTH